MASVLEQSHKIYRVSIFGVPVDVVDMDMAVQRVRQLVCEKNSAYVFAVNSEKVLQIRDNVHMKQYFQRAGLLIPDGIGVVATIRILGYRFVQRVTGVELMTKLCEEAVREKWKVFIYGGRPQVVEAAVASLLIRFPCLEICGYRNGYLTDSEMMDMVEEIKVLSPEILFIALGSPKQELWVENFQENFRVGIIQGVGGALDVLSGYTPRAPIVFQKLGMEWLFRTLAEPSKKRINRAFNNLKYMIKVFTHLRGLCLENRRLSRKAREIEGEQ